MVSHKSVPALFVLVWFLSVCCSGQLIYKDIQDGAILKVEIDQDYSLEFPVYPNTSFTLKTFSIVIPQNPSGRIISIEGTTTLSHTPDVPCFDYSVRLSDVPEANTLVSTFGPNKGYYYLDLPYSPCSTYILMKPAISTQQRRTPSAH
ncbi:hypothetical protein C9374_002983 [Naegleria lovaniensis]|uniref:Uncharacterized protein n=1 Tax=Naegleria lovaniensis TaxID=51637 RepID=A0AA88GU68_NAELO|nr:uncharacterized protein C9374_002983 [Naegleria lovaniensis]KAG2385834.1 hypothetical protein C9374_002983 [Naegleria lovaniensis]